MDNILANNMIKKTPVIFLLCAFLYGCSPKKVELSPQIPFQCINTQTRCEITTDFGTVFVKFNVENIKTELPFSIQVTLIKDALREESINSPDNLKVLGYMEGKTMFMGKIPLFFIEEEAQGKQNASHTAETMLGSCSEETMTWRLWITLEKQSQTDQSQQSTFFIDFDSSRF